MRHHPGRLTASQVPDNPGWMPLKARNMKETYYFSHDYNARTDEKIKRLLKKYGMTGYGIFWSIVEDLYNNANAMRTDYDDIAFDLRTDDDIVKSIVNDFDLFVIKNDFFSSQSIERRLEVRKKKTESARQSAIKRWSKKSNDLLIDCDSNPNAFKNGAIYKGNDIKDIEDIKDTTNNNNKEISELNPLSANKNEDSEQDQIQMMDTGQGIDPETRERLGKVISEISKSQYLLEEEFQSEIDDDPNMQDEKVFTISREKVEMPEKYDQFIENETIDAKSIKDDWL